MHDKFYYEVLRHVPERGCAVGSMFVAVAIYGRKCTRSEMASVTQRLQHCLKVDWVSKLDQETPTAYQLTPKGRVFIEQYQRRP